VQNGSLRSSPEAAAMYQMKVDTILANRNFLLRDYNY
jgi:hypothetical protein